MSRLARLRQDLIAYRPASPDLLVFRDQMRELCDRGEEAFVRGTFEPGHFTASAFVLSADRAQLLLILHAKLGLWLQPGGHVDADDASMIEAARREAIEETGVEDLEPAHDGIFDVDVHEIPPLGNEPAHRHFDVRFLFRAGQRELRAATDARAARWAPLEEIIAGAVSSDASVGRAARQIVGR